MSVDVQVTDRVSVTITTICHSAFEGDGQSQIAVVWVDDREFARLERHRCRRLRGYGHWHAWWEQKWYGLGWVGTIAVDGGLLQYLSLVSDLL